MSIEQQLHDQLERDATIFGLLVGQSGLHGAAAARITDESGDGRRVANGGCTDAS